MNQKFTQTPLYKHHCANCTYLGDWEYKGQRHDLYHCPQLGIPTVIARYGDEGPAYTSGMSSPYPALVEARRRAIERGLPV